VNAKTGIRSLNPDPRQDAGCNISLPSLIGGLGARFAPIVATLPIALAPGGLAIPSTPA
jgi:hypothetical protein